MKQEILDLGLDVPKEFHDMPESEIILNTGG